MRTSDQEILEDLEHTLDIVLFQLSCNNQKEYHFHYITDACLPILELTPHEIMDSFQIFIDIILEPDKQRFKDELVKSCKEMVMMDWEGEILSNSKARRWIQIRCKPRQLSNKTITLTGYISDITSQKNVELSLIQKSIQLELVVQSSSDGFWDWDLETNEIYFSPRWKDMLGYSEQEIPNSVEAWKIVLSKEDFCSYIQKIKDYNSGKIDEFKVVYKFIHKNGSPIFIFSRAIHVRNTEGKVVRMLGTNTDITFQKLIEIELQKAKEKAEQASIAKAQFLSIMSHEIRTPMNAVIGMSNILLSENPKPEQLENLNILKFSAESLLVLINDILDFSKIEAGKIELEEVTIDVPELLVKIKEQMNAKAIQKGIELKLTIDTEIPTQLIGDPVRLSQILNNLISNAIKFTENGYVHIITKLESFDTSFYTILFCIEDTGIGIHENKLDLIFEKFTQASSDTTRKYGGTGLGLAITKKIIEMYDSQIFVESQFGKGSKFYFKLKFKSSKKHNASYVTDKKKSHSTELTNIKLLLVEDNEINILVIQKFFRKWNLNYDIAKNGLEAIQKFEKNKYDIILMDLQMPEMDGIKATSIIRKMEANSSSKVPIIAVTAEAVSEIKERVISVGMDDCITKPFNPSEVYEKIVYYTSFYSIS